MGTGASLRLWKCRTFRRRSGVDLEMRRLAVFAFLLAFPVSAGAGGDPPQLAACGGTVWVAGAGNLASLDVSSGRFQSRPTSPRWYPIAVACRGRLAWVI